MLRVPPAAPCCIVTLTLALVGPVTVTGKPATGFTVTPAPKSAVVVLSQCVFWPVKAMVAVCPTPSVLGETLVISGGGAMLTVYACEVVTGTVSVACTVKLTAPRPMAFPG